MPSIPKKILYRQHEITMEFMKAVDAHISDIVEGRVQHMFEIRDFAELLHIHPTHLSNTIKLTTGNSPCHFFEYKIMDVAKVQLANPSLPIAHIAAALTFDPSNFTKFFKRFEGITPKEYREQVLLGSLSTTQLPKS